MKKSALLLMVCVCLGGECGTSQLIPPPSAQSLITNDLRRLCPFADDDFLVTLITLVRADRDAGLTKSQILLDGINGCNIGCAEGCAADPDCDFGQEVACRMDCANCSTAIVELVFP